MAPWFKIQGIKSVKIQDIRTSACLHSGMGVGMGGCDCIHSMFCISLITLMRAVLKLDGCGANNARAQ